MALLTSARNGRLGSAEYRRAGVLFRSGARRHHRRTGHHGGRLAGRRVLQRRLRWARFNHRTALVYANDGTANSAGPHAGHRHSGVAMRSGSRAAVAMSQPSTGRSRAAVHRRRSSATPVSNTSGQSPCGRRAVPARLLFGRSGVMPAPDGARHVRRTRPGARRNGKPTKCRTGHRATAAAGLLAPIPERAGWRRPCAAERSPPAPRTSRSPLPGCASRTDRTRTRGDPPSPARGGPAKG